MNDKSVDQFSWSGQPQLLRSVDSKTCFHEFWPRRTPKFPT